MWFSLYQTISNTKIFKVDTPAYRLVASGRKQRVEMPRKVRPPVMNKQLFIAIWPLLVGRRGNPVALDQQRHVL